MLHDLQFRPYSAKPNTIHSDRNTNYRQEAFIRTVTQHHPLFIITQNSEFSLTDLNYSSTGYKHYNRENATMEDFH